MDWHDLFHALQLALVYHGHPAKLDPFSGVPV